MVRKTRRSVLRDAGLVSGLLAGGGFALDSAAADTSAEGSNASAEGSTRYADAGADWSTLRATPARTAFTSMAGPVEAPFADRAPESIPSVYSAPSVVDGVAYYSTGGHGMTVAAYDTNGETTLWEADVPVGSDPGVAVDDGTVYVLGGSRTIQDCVPVPPTLAAIDAADGTVRWEYEVDDGPASRPAVVDGTTYAVVDDSLIAVDDGGTKIWGTALPHHTSQLPAVADGFVVTSGHEGVAALDASDGSEVWHSEVSTVKYPTIADGTVYVVDGDDLVALALADGTRRWRTASTDDDYVEFTQAPAVGRGRVYGMRDDDRVQAFATADGSREWLSSQVGDGQICVGDETVYVGVMKYFGNTPSVSALDATDGDLRWQHPVRDMDTDGTPVLADGTLFFGGDALPRLASDHPGVQWRETIASGDGSAQALDNEPVVTADTVVTAGAETGYQPDNAVVAVDRSTREHRWSYATGDPVTQLFDAGNGLILVGTEERIVVLDEADGTVELRISDDDVQVTTASVLDDRVFVTIEPQNAERPYLASFDVTTGEEQWRFRGLPAESEGPLYETGALFAADGQVFASVVETADDDSVVALDAATGEVHWHVSGSDRLTGITDGLVFTRSDSELSALSATDGSVRWRTEIPSTYGDAVGVAAGDGSVYVADDGDRWDGVKALSLEDGSVRWSTSITDYEGSHSVAPVYADGTVYLSYGRQVIGVDATDGAIRDFYVTRGAVGGVVHATDAVYVTDESGYLTAIDPFA